jgi:large subunit ribosomal protein L15
MMIHDITALAGRHKARKRVGRGHASGQGKQAGRGHKGARSRAGFGARHQFEGGQMPLFRRLPKFGFSNARFETRFWTVNLDQIIAHPRFARGGEVTIDSLVEAGLVRDGSRDLKVLGRMPEGVSALPVRLKITASRVSAPARALVEGAGGSVHETGTRRDRVRGVDRNSADRAPKNLTKKGRPRSGKAPAKAPQPQD